MVDISQLTDEQISWRFNNFKNELIRQGHNINTRQFIEGVRSGKYDVNEYIQRNKIESQEARVAAAKRRLTTHVNTTAASRLTITCPYCQSTDCSKIGVVGRSVSFGLFGFGSSKVGKQWHCNKCKSDF